MEYKYHGTAVSPGVAIGPALVLDAEGVLISHKTVPPDQIKEEVARLYRALDEVAADAREDRERMTVKLGTDIGNIWAVRETLANSAGIRRQIETRIRTNEFSAEYAVSRVIREFVQQLEDPHGRSPDSLLAARRQATDVIDLERRILAALLGHPANPLSNLSEPVILLANDLMPSDTADFSSRTVRAFATESGGPTSHTAILAGALEIPAVVGIGRFLTSVSGGDVVIVDGTDGVLIIDPDEATLARYEAKRAELLARPDRYESLRDKPAVTNDKPPVPIRLLGNIELAQEAAHCLDRGAEGVGLYRTEFLYLNKTAHPSEDEHYEAYTSVLEKLGPNRPVVIRTLDLGADKFSSVSGAAAEEKNPFLGLRSVRLCLHNLDLFKTQLRAILRSAVHGDLRVMFPMISTVDELRKCKHLMNEVKEDLEYAGIPFKREVPVGTMIEVPSAAILSDVLAREVDFFSIGTNDLIQYTLAADRNNEHVADLYNPLDPAVLRLIRTVVLAAKKEQEKRPFEVNVCGEMSGEPLYIPLLVGLGLRQLSATPRKIPEIKRVIRDLRVAEAERVAAHALTLESARQVRNYLRDQLGKILPPDGAD